MQRERTFRFPILEVIIGLSLIFLLRPAAGAEIEKGQKRILSLQQMIAMAIAKSPEIAETRSEIAGTQSDLEQVQSAYYPQIEGLGFIGPVNDAKRPAVRGTRIIDPSPDAGFSTLGAFGRLEFTVTQPLYTFGKLANRKEAASRGVKAREFKLSGNKLEIALKIKQLYYGLILARAGTDAARDADTFFDDARKRMTRLLELGSTNVVESDLYRVDAYRANNARSKAEAEKGTKVAYFALKALIGLPSDVEFDVSEKTLPLREEVLSNQDLYVQKALEDRPEFKQLDEALAAQDSLVQAVQSDRYPSFFMALAGSLAGAPGRETFHNPYISDEFNHANVGVVAGVKWNFDFGISQARVDKERAEYERLLHAKDTGKLNIPIQVAKSYQETHEWKVAVDAYRKAASASRKWVIASLTSFDMGVGTADDMLKAIEKYGENQGKFLEALFNYNLSFAELEYATAQKDW